MAHHRGIDVYVKYQTVRSWSQVRTAGYEFCYVKASDGSTIRSTGGYGSRGRAAGLLMGSYHYAQPGNARAQADLLIHQARADNLMDLAPALDLEDPFVPGRDAASFAVAFLRRVRETGNRPCLYGNNTMLSAVLPAVKAAVPDTVVWVARYGGTPTVSYDLWQYTDKGTVPGIAASSVDLNRGALPVNVPSIHVRTTATREDDLQADEREALFRMYEQLCGQGAIPQDPAKRYPGWDTVVGRKTVVDMLQELLATLRGYQPSRIAGDTNRTNLVDLVFDSAKWTFEDRATLVELRDKLNQVIAKVGA